MLKRIVCVMAFAMSHTMTAGGPLHSLWGALKTGGWAMREAIRHRHDDVFSVECGNKVRVSWQNEKMTPYVRTTLCTPLQDVLKSVPTKGGRLLDQDAYYSQQYSASAQAEYEAKNIEKHLECLEALGRMLGAAPEAEKDYGEIAVKHRLLNDMLSGAAKIGPQYKGECAEGMVFSHVAPSGAKNLLKHLRWWPEGMANELMPRCGHQVREAQRVLRQKGVVSWGLTADKRHSQCAIKKEWLHKAYQAIYDLLALAQQEPAPLSPHLMNMLRQKNQDLYGLCCGEWAC